MKTLLVTGRDPAPDALRELIRRHSSSLDEVSAADLSTFVSREGFGVDRIAFWAGAGDHEVRALALNYATAAGAGRRETVVYITPVTGEPTLDGMSSDEVLVWPRDEARIRDVFRAA
jgi:hypothetical protein